MQALDEVHDTPARVAWLGLVGLGVGWIDQEVPFHDSARVRRLPGPPNSPANPTAVQALADVHDTPDSPLTWSCGLGVGWMDQEVPFHLSARVSTVELMPALVR